MNIYVHIYMYVLSDVFMDGLIIYIYIYIYILGQRPEVFKN